MSHSSAVQTQSAAGCQNSGMAAYLGSVTATFNNRPDIRDEFVSTMKEFKAHKIDRATVVEKVSGLFKDYPILQRGFLACIPPEYRASEQDSTGRTRSTTGSSDQTAVELVKEEDEDSHSPSAAKRPLSVAPDDAEGPRRRKRAKTSPTESLSSLRATRSVDISHLISRISRYSFNQSGRVCDLFVGVHATEGSVALKRLRIGLTEYTHVITQEFLKDVGAWRFLDHGHVLKFLGVCYVGGVLHVATPFMRNGALPQYIRLHPKADRLQLLRETAEAIAYLHGLGIVHGDIKGSNVLISDDGGALVCDFGLERYHDVRVGGAMRRSGTLRWEAPELWKNAPRSVQSDVYSFAMLIAEVLTGGVPFANYSQASAIIAAVSARGERPAMVPMFSPASTGAATYYPAWSAARLCWQMDPSKRPSMVQVVEILPRRAESGSEIASSGSTGGLDVACFDGCPGSGVASVSCSGKKCERKRYHLHCLGMSSVPGRSWRCLDCEERSEYAIPLRSKTTPCQNFSFMIHPQGPNRSHYPPSPKLAMESSKLPEGMTSGFPLVEDVASPRA